MSVIELTDITSVRQFMQKSLSDKLEDETLEVMIRQASEEVQRFCNREFLPASTATRTFELLPNTNEWHLLNVAPYEYRTVESVIVDGDTEKPTTLEAKQYRKWPLPSRDGTYFGVRLAGLPAVPVIKGLESSMELPYQTRQVEVKAAWGLGAVPQGLQHLTNVTVKAWAWSSHGAAMASRPDEFVESSYLAGTDELPLDVQRALVKRWHRDAMTATA